jgi:hypothetical protein
LQCDKGAQTELCFSYALSTNDSSVVTYLFAFSSPLSSCRQITLRTCQRHTTLCHAMSCSVCIHVCVCVYNRSLSRLSTRMRKEQSLHTRARPQQQLLSLSLSLVPIPSQLLQSCGLLLQLGVCVCVFVSIVIGLDNDPTNTDIRLPRGQVKSNAERKIGPLLALSHVGKKTAIGTSGLLWLAGIALLNLT